MTAGSSAEPWTLMALEDRPERHLIRAKHNFNALYQRQEDRITPQKRQDKKIRIGYFSADICHHATMILLWPLIVRRNKERFELYLYNYAGDIEDAITAQTQRLVDCYRDIKKMNEEECINLARSDELDIAIDLKGFTRDARLSLFARRIAPIQIAYLGYPGSMGATCFDYLVADKTLIPKQERQYYSEDIIYMPHSYQPSDNARPVADHSFTRAELGLPDQGFVFACFNANYKIQPREFAIWMNLLKHVNGSVLWLYKSNDTAAANLRSKAEEFGVAQERLIFAEPMATKLHLARLRCADLFLDTFNVNAHTTASDALWIGLPVLTKPGRSFTARVGASLLNAIEMPELIAQDEQDYEAKAFYYATNPDAYQAMRQKLWDHRLTTPLFDSDGYVRAFEERMEQVYLASLEESKLADISP
jgi:predicted O-linked N-acetylglucosamine transferase (SPINDLY family)